MRFFLSLLALFILPGAAVALWDGLLFIAADPKLWIPLLTGLGAGALIYLLVIRKLPALSTFEHEFTHALVALLFLRKIRQFKVTWRQGGQVQYTGSFGGKFGDLMIGLAPYYLPTLPLAMVLVRPFLPPEWFPWYDGITGFAFACHFFSTAEETRLSWTKRTFVSAGDSKPSKSDIGKVGYLTAFLVITGLGLLFLGMAFRMTGRGYRELWPFVRQVATVSWKVYSVLVKDLYSFILPYIRLLFS